MKITLNLLLSCLLVISVIGCSKSGPQRVDVAGTVTHDGVSVKAGFVVFTPDTQKGGKGPQGLAFIKNGQFDTRGEKGKGLSPGPQLVQVNGFDGLNITDDNEFGKPIFTTHTISQTISTSNLQMNLEVPKNPGKSK